MNSILTSTTRIIPNSAITYTITTPPTKGSLLKNGVPTSSFTQDDLDNNLISYHETAPSSSALSDSFFFRASDPAGNQTNTTLFQINITPSPGNPVNETVPGSVAVYAGLSAAIGGVRIVDDNLLGEDYTTVITATSGTLWVTGAAVNGLGTSSLSITGKLAAVNGVLGSLYYKGADAGPQTITVTTTDLADQTSISKTINVAVKPQGSFSSIDVPLADRGTIAHGINSAGQIVGYGLNSGNQPSGFLLTGNTLTNINNTGSQNGFNYFNTSPQDINDPGQIAGVEKIAPGPFSPTYQSGFVYSNGTFTSTDYQTQPGNQVVFEDINNSGQTVGYYYNLAPRQPIIRRSFTYQNDAYQPFGPDHTQAEGINSNGDIVGLFFPQFGFKGFLYKNGVFSVFDAPNATATAAQDINDAGIIVGYYHNTSATSHGFAYVESTGTWTTIDVPGALSTVVYGINNSNQIVGTYVDGNGLTHGFQGQLPPPLPSFSGNVDEWILVSGGWSASAQPGSHPAGARVAAVADFTGDGTSDILWQDVNTGAVDLWKINYGAWNGSVDLGTHPGAAWQIAGAGDFNGDGTSDVFWFNPATGETDIWQLANGQWAASVSPGSHPSGYQVAGIGDFNHDGTSDVLWFNPTTRHVDEWNIVNGQWADSNSIGFYPDSGFQIAGVGDFNNDGTGDVFWHNPSTGATDIWLLQNGMWFCERQSGQSSDRLSGRRRRRLQRRRH